MADGLKFTFRLTVAPNVRQVMSGLVSPQVALVAKKVLEAAKPLIGTEYSGTTGRSKEPRKGRLKDSGGIERQSKGGWAVVFNHPAAAVHHTGAKEHSIGGKDQRLGNKNFPNTRVDHPKYKNRLFFASGPVRHPGTTGNPYLTNAAKKVGLRLSGSLKRGTEGPFPIARSRGFF